MLIPAPLSVFGQTVAICVQEVREIFPNLVVEGEEGMLSIDYNGFIPVLVQAVKNLTRQVEEQANIISSLSEDSRKARKIS